MLSKRVSGTCCNVGLEDGRIAIITADDIEGRETINAWGHVVAPGFIYLPGITSVDAAAIDPTTSDIDLRDNHGAMITYLHRWSEKFRSTVMYGTAKSDVLDWQPGTTTGETVYTSVNLMWQVAPYITLGFEIAYGELTCANNDSIDNTRVAAGMQLF